MMPLSHCISTLGCPALDVEQTLDFAHRHQLDGVELRSLVHRIDLPQLFAERYGSPDALAATVADHPVRIVSLDTSLQLFANQPVDRAELLNFVPWAEALGVPWLRVFDGGTSVAQDIAVAEDTMQWWREAKATHGWNVDLMVETHDALIDAAAIERLQKTCPGTAILWDTHHTWKMGGEAVGATWERIAPHVVHLHVKDSTPEPGPVHPFTFALPGEGDFPMRELRDAVGDGFKGMAALEWEVHWHPELPALETALTTARNNQWW